MNISDNILKENLKNVYFLCGGAYGGKTTMAKLIEAKYGFLRYRQGDNSDRFAALAQPEYQPALSLDRSRDWHGFFSQPPEKYSRWLEDGLYEEAEFAVMDLVKLAENRVVIADAQIPVDLLKRIADPSHVVLLFAPREMTEKYYFEREDKSEVKRFILSFPDGEELYENVIAALNYGADEKIREFYSSGFMCIERTEGDTVERTLEAIERHFGLK